MNDTDSFLEFLPRVLWRTAKEDVIEELGVPEQKVVLHRLEFSPVESHFYQTQHEECSALFIQKISRYIHDILYLLQIILYLGIFWQYLVGYFIHFYFPTIIT